MEDRPANAVRADQGFPKRDRILHRPDFLTIQGRGGRVHTTHFTIALLDRGDGGGPRIGLTASRKSGNSVVRNRVRRLLREVFRVHRDAFPAGHDCVVIVHENVPDLGLVQVRDEVLAALVRRPRRASPPGAKPRADASRPRQGAPGQSSPRATEPTPRGSSRGKGRG